MHSTYTKKRMRMLLNNIKTLKKDVAEKGKVLKR
jgi:hypothetical protein